MRIPPGGWKYIQAETGMEIRGGDYYDLREKVRRHRQLNRLVTGPELDDQIQSQICEHMDPAARASWCRDKEIKIDPSAAKQIDFNDVKHFLSTLGNLKKFVPQAEAQRRAEICAACPQNIPIAGCTSCRNLVGLVFKVIGQRKTPFDHLLRGCGVCGCSLTASVHIPLEAFPTQPHYEYPKWCWKN